MGENKTLHCIAGLGFWKLHGTKASKTGLNCLKGQYICCAPGLRASTIFMMFSGPSPKSEGLVFWQMECVNGKEFVFSGFSKVSLFFDV